MGFPKQIKKTIPLIDKKILLPRRHEIANMISDDGTYLPKSLLHADLDRGFLDFVKEKFNITSEGKTIPVDISPGITWSKNHLLTFSAPIAFTD